MPILNFPNNPSVGDTYTGNNGISYIWDGNKWGGHTAAIDTINTNSSYIINNGNVIQVDGDGNLVIPVGATILDAQGNQVITGGGAIGATGPVGATGIQGATGDTGATGEKGATGSTGPVGATGFQGATGDTGATGELGSTGATGYKGTTGATGPQGISVTLQGTKATIGDLPLTGSAGHGWIVTTGDGNTHLNGSLWFWNVSEGAWNDIGPIVGPEGGPGPDGATGMYGATGATGPQGDVGATGFQGATGDTGNDGSTGATGPQGDVGATGSKGDPGDPGTADLGNYSFSNDTITNDAVNSIILASGGNSWEFKTNGKLQLPSGGDIVDSNGLTVLGGTGGSGDSLVNGDSSFGISPDGTLTLTHPDEPNFHPLETQLIIQKAAGNYHTISGAYGLSLQATPVPSGYGLNTNTNFVDIFHDGISVNVDNNTWAFGTGGDLTFPSGGKVIGDSQDGTYLQANPGNDGYAGLSSLNGNSWMWTANDGGAYISSSDGATVKNWSFNTDGKLTLPMGGDIVDSNGLTVLGGGSTGTSWNLTSQGNGCPIDVTLTTGTFDIQVPRNHLFFRDDGSWDIGSYVNETYITGDTSGGNGIGLTTDRGTVLFGNTPELCAPTAGSHFHIMRDDPTTVDLFFGDDLNYVKLPYDSTLTNVGVQIGTDATNLWSFGKDGVLTLPNGATIVDTTSTLVLTPNSPAQVTSLVLRSTYSTYLTADYPNRQSYDQWNYDNNGGPPPTTSTTTSTEGTAVAITLWDSYGHEYSQGDVEYVITGTGITAADFTPAVLTGTFLAANWISDGGIGYTNTNMLMIANDAIVEGEETFTVTIVTTGTTGWAANEGNYLRVNIADGTTEGSESGHIHLISENMAQTSIFLGNDDKYVKVGSDDQIYINVPNVDNSATSHTWTFDGAGVLTLPGGNTRIGDVFGSGADGIVGSTGTTVGVASQGQGGYVGLQWIDSPENIETTSTQVAAVVINSPIALTTGTVQILTGITTGTGIGSNIWEFGVDGTLTIPDDIQDANGSVVRVATTSTAPTRVNGQLWYNSEEGRTYIKYNDQWVDANPVVVPSPGTYLQDITIDGSTLNINGGTLTIDDTGTLLVNGSEVTGSGGSVSFEYSTVQEGVDDVDKPVTSITGLADTGISLTSDRWSQLMWVPDATAVSINDISDGSTVYNWAFVDNIGFHVETDDGPNNYQWVFNKDGMLTLPSGSVIKDGMGAIRLEPSGASSSTQALLIYPTAGGDGNHIHLTAGGGGTDLYLGNDDQFVKVDHSGSIVIGAVGANTSTWTFGTDGSLTLPGGRTRIGTTVDSDAIIANEDEVFGVLAQGTNGAVQLVWIEDLENAYTSNLAAVYVNSGGPGSVRIATGANGGPGPKFWEFNNSGELEFPQGSTISETNTTTIISPPGASAGQSLVIRPTGSTSTTETNHIHLISGNPTTVDLFLGDDDQYVKIEKNGGNIVVGTNTTATTSTWTFGTDGVLTLSTASTILGNSSDPNVYIETATTATTSTWTFGTNGILTLPAATPVIKGGGTGTDVTVIATTGTNTATWVFAADGGLKFPNNTVQTTAWTGTSVLVNGTYTVALSTTGQLNLPGAANTESGNARIQSANSIDVLSNLSKWTFGTGGKTSLASGVEISNTGTFNFLSWNTGSALILANTVENAPSVIYIPSSSDTVSRVSIANTNTTGGVILVQGPGDSQSSLEVNSGGVFISTVVNNFQTGAWQFSSTGTLKFPDNTLQTTAYVPATASASTYTGWFKAAGTVVQLDTLLARINSTGTMQISSTIVETIGQGSAFAWNGVRNQGATMSAFGQGGTNWVNPGDWLDISATPLDNNFEVATVSVFKLGGTGSLYRITYVGCTSSGWAVNIERVAQG